MDALAHRSQVVSFHFVFPLTVYAFLLFIEVFFFVFKIGKINPKATASVALHISV